MKRVKDINEAFIVSNDDAPFRQHYKLLVRHAKLAPVGSPDQKWFEPFGDAMADFLKVHRGKLASQENNVKS